MTANMIAFRADPENPGRIIVAVRAAATRSALAERELAAMQRDLASMLQQKSRLAALGLAVSKINHDLRNLLTSAQLFSDRPGQPARPACAALCAEADARARARHRVLPIDAVLRPRCRSRRPIAACIALEPLVEEVRETLGLDPECRDRAGSARSSAASWSMPTPTSSSASCSTSRATRCRRWRAAAPKRSRPRPDPHHRPARGRGGGDRGLRHRARLSGSSARAHLFEAFQGSTRTGGTGLGLAIAAELVRAHGGEIRLVEGTIGATFRLTIPDRAVELSARRGERARA